MLKQNQLLLLFHIHVILQKVSCKTMKLHKFGTSISFLQSLKHKNAPMNTCNSNKTYYTHLHKILQKVTIKCFQQPPFLVKYLDNKSNKNPILY